MFVMPKHADKNESISTSVRPSQGLHSPDGSSGRCEMYHTHLDYSQRECMATGQKVARNELDRESGGCCAWLWGLSEVV